MYPCLGENRWLAIEYFTEAQWRALVRVAGPREWVDDARSRRSCRTASPQGFGREGLSRRIAYYKCVALVEGANIVRRELGLPETRVRASDPSLYFAR